MRQSAVRAIFRVRARVGRSSPNRVVAVADRARFVEADLYDAVAAIPDARTFDVAYVTWGAICWLPDISRWCEIVAKMLRPGGSLYLADGHPAALVLDDAVAASDGTPGARRLRARTQR
jgi:SAM-dependent methyltransferase